MSKIAVATEGGSRDIVDVDVRAWIEKAHADPVLKRDRQVTEIVLATIGISPNLRDTMVLKGGTVMALAFRSDRVTGDIDFSADADPDEFAAKIVEELNSLLPRVAIRLGYVDLICKVQSVRKMPRAKNFSECDFPALNIRIGSAIRGTKEERWLNEGRSTRVLDIEITFRDQVYAFQDLCLTEAKIAVRAFTVHEIIAEKLRALLQQPIRNRYRRQDIFDIAFLLDTENLDDKDREEILSIFIRKCRSRSISPTIKSIENPEIERRARAEWDSLKLENANLPEFDERFTVVFEFYKSLPWTSI